MGAGRSSPNSCAASTRVCSGSPSFSRQSFNAVWSADASGKRSLSFLAKHRSISRDVSSLTSQRIVRTGA